MIFREEDVGGRERVTTDEERVARGEGAEQRSGCANKKVEQWQEFCRQEKEVYIQCVH